MGKIEDLENHLQDIARGLTILAGEPLDIRPTASRF